jgi:curved DNA-binding protein CbpA
LKDLSEQSHYEVLELVPGCAADALLKAYALARERYSPGSLATYALAEPGEAEALLRRVEEAFAVLSDPERRQAYDTAGGFASASWDRSLAAPVPEMAPQQPTPPPPASEPGPAVTEASKPVEPPPAELSPPVAVATEPAALTAEPPAESRQSAASEPMAEAHRETQVEAGPSQTPEPTPEPVAEPSPEPQMEARPEPLPEPQTEAPAAKVEPEHKPVRKTESELPADSAVTGEALRRVREARGLTLKDVESRTKIGRWHLENIERDRYADLPAQVYLRGFLMSFARELKLDPVRVARSYLEQMKAKPQAKTE